LPKSAAGEALTVWALCFAAIVITWVLPPTKSFAKLVATAGFLYLPLWASAQRGEDYREYGLSLSTLGKDLKQFAAWAAIVFPAFVLGYVLFTHLYPSLPESWTRILTPYVGEPHFALRLPDRFGEWTVDQIFVVALPEEFFYRGYIQTRLKDAWPRGPVVFGVRLGPAFWATAALFALGHLAIFQVWRLAVFFPALIFGFMRERTDSVVGAALLHGTANLLVKVLDASFFGAG